MKRIVLLLLLALAPALLPAGPAGAHASLVGSEPADGAVLAAPPEELALRFSEAVTPLVLKLVRPDGGGVVLDAPAAAAEVIRAGLPADLGPGTHVLSWRVVSADGHPVAGALLFSVGTASAAPAADAYDPAVRGAVWLTRLGLYVGLLAGAGGAFFAAWIAVPAVGTSRLLAGLLGVGLVCAVLSVSLQGTDALGVGLPGLAAAAVWRAGAATSLGPAALLAGLAMLLGLSALVVRGRPARSRPARLLAAAALAGCGAALAASGHAANASPQWFARAAVFVHGAAAGYWVGALLPLALLLRSGGAGSALARFSAGIPWVLAALVAAGTVLLILQVPDPAMVFDTAYGAVLLAKLSLVLAVLAVAAVNRWRLTHPAGRGDRRAAGRLARLVLLETVLMAAVLGTVALWRFTPPPRVLAVPVIVAEAHLHEARAMADLTLARDRHGVATATIVVMTGDFGPLDPKEMTLILSSPAAGLEPLRRPARRAGDGTWRVEGLALPVPGRWQLRLDILASDFEMVTLESGLDVAR